MSTVYPDAINPAACNPLYEGGAGYSAPVTPNISVIANNNNNNHRLAIDHQNPESSTTYRQNYGAGYDSYEGEYNRSARLNRLENGGGVGVASSNTALVSYNPDEAAALNQPIQVNVINSSDESVCWDVPCRLADTGFIFRSALVKIAGRFVPFLYFNGRKIDLNLSLWESGVKDGSILATGVGASVKARTLMPANNNKDDYNNDHLDVSSSSRQYRGAAPSASHRSRLDSLRPPGGSFRHNSRPDVQYNSNNSRMTMGGGRRAMSADPYVNPYVGSNQMGVSGGVYPPNLYNNPTSAMRNPSHFVRAASAPRAGRRYYDDDYRFSSSMPHHQPQQHLSGHGHASSVYGHRERQADLARERQDILGSSLSNPRWNSSTNLDSRTRRFGSPSGSYSRHQQQQYIDDELLDASARSRHHFGPDERGELRRTLVPGGSIVSMRHRPNEEDDYYRGVGFNHQRLNSSAPLPHHHQRLSSPHRYLANNEEYVNGRHMDGTIDYHHGPHLQSQTRMYESDYHQHHGQQQQYPHPNHHQQPSSGYHYQSEKEYRRVGDGDVHSSYRVAPYQRVPYTPHQFVRQIPTPPGGASSGYYPQQQQQHYASGGGGYNQPSPYQQQGGYPMGGAGGMALNHYQQGVGSIVGGGQYQHTSAPQYGPSPYQHQQQPPYNQYGPQQHVHFA